MRPRSFFSFIGARAAKIWWSLPLSVNSKERIKSILFRLIPGTFLKTKVYRNWLNAQNAFFLKSEDVKDSLSWPVTILPQFEIKPSELPPVKSLAVAIHVYYIDVFDDILQLLKGFIDQHTVLYITTPPENLDKIKNKLLSYSFRYRLFGFHNRGRDILPFLKTLPVIFSDEHQLVLKIHTKQSSHRKTGMLWRQDLYRKLLKDQAAVGIINAFNLNREIGIMGPSGHIVPMQLYYGANASTIQRLCEKLGIGINNLKNLTFVAGSMFFVRKEALIPLLKLGLQDSDFEPESGQLDGTMAHAIERFFAISTYAAGLKITDTENSRQVTENYPFMR